MSPFVHIATTTWRQSALAPVACFALAVALTACAGATSPQQPAMSSPTIVASPKAWVRPFRRGRPRSDLRPMSSHALVDRWFRSVMSQTTRDFVPISEQYALFFDRPATRKNSKRLCDVCVVCSLSRASLSSVLSPRPLQLTG
jgi:hypothetical protein